MSAEDRKDTATVPEAADQTESHPVSGAVGAAAGAVVGAAAGALGGPLGAAAGAVAGAVLGGMAGSATGKGIDSMARGEGNTGVPLEREVGADHSGDEQAPREGQGREP
jgi:phage tail tape-measure protein